MIIATAKGDKDIRWFEQMNNGIENTQLMTAYEFQLAFGILAIVRSSESRFHRVSPARPRSSQEPASTAGRLNSLNP
jgi:hypothetical protein